ncbi:MAG: zinc ribbon domain-containing protein [Ruminococcaceae bacterium]|nr:zinc ribbon domain-containing protein [Oscillospiraceae bacterium]
MEKRFCPDCGTEIIGEGAFCPKCGRTLNQPQMQQMPVQQIPMQQIPTQPMPTPAMGMMYIPPRNTKKIWGIVGGCFAAAAVITGIILLIIFSGNPAGEIIKDYRYKDIVGSYSGVATIDSIGVGGDYEEIADHQGLDSEKILKRSEDDEIDCSLSLTDSTLTISLDDPLFLGSREFTIDDVDFNNGRAKDSTDDEIKDGNLEDSEITIDYNLTLHEGVSRNTEYRIYGTVEIQYDLVLFGIEGTYEIELTIDCDK